MLVKVLVEGLLADLEVVIAGQDLLDAKRGVIGDSLAFTRPAFPSL